MVVAAAAAAAAWGDPCTAAGVAIAVAASQHSAIVASPLVTCQEVVSAGTLWEWFVIVMIVGGCMLQTRYQHLTCS